MSFSPKPAAHVAVRNNNRPIASMVGHPARAPHQLGRECGELRALQLLRHSSRLRVRLNLDVEKAVEEARSLFAQGAEIVFVVVSEHGLQVSRDPGQRYLLSV